MFVYFKHISMHTTHMCVKRCKNVNELVRTTMRLLLYCVRAHADIFRKLNQFHFDSIWFCYFTYEYARLNVLASRIQFDSADS